MSTLPLLMFDPLAEVMAEAIQGEKAALLEQMFKGRWATLSAGAAIQELPPDYRRPEAIPTSMSEQQALVEMNARFAYVHQAGEEGAVLYFGPEKVELRV